MKRIVSILIVMLLITTILSTLGLAKVTANQINNTLLYDELDQQSTQVNKAKAIGSSDEELAQSFTPTLPTLTRVILRLKSFGSEEFQYYYVNIKESYSGPTLTSAKINRDILVVGSNFCEFDFPDISVTPGNTYFIVVAGETSTGDTSSLLWWYGYPDPYPGGDAWYESIAAGWNYLQEGVVRCDFYFETYGTSNQPPNNPVCSYDRINDDLVVTATDPDGDQLRYGVDWNNDLTIDQWTGLVPSGTEQRINCGGKSGSVGVLAEDEHGAQSNPVSVKSKSKQYIKFPFLDFLQQHLNLFPMLRMMLQYFLY